MNNFMQVFHEYDHMLTRKYGLTVKKECNSDCSNISQNKQRVLFYISGYIIYALHRKYERSGTLNKQKLYHVLGFSSEKSSEATKQYAAVFENKNNKNSGLKLLKNNFPWNRQ
jgi:hypothetical protein